jgi:hypothetical protein
MGAWGEGPFDNDGACDWAYEFRDVDEATGLQILAAALDLGDPDDYVEAPEGESAVAAALVVSWLMNPESIPDSPYGESAAAWVRSTRAPVSAALRASALAALDRVRGEQSELAELWAEADGEAWIETLSPIKAQLLAGT